MEESTSGEISVVITCQKLVELAECSCRMTQYADPNGTRLISVVKSQESTPVRLILDKECIRCNCNSEITASPCNNQTMPGHIRKLISSSRRK